MSASRALEELEGSLTELRGVRRDMGLAEASRSGQVAGSLDALTRAQARLTEAAEVPIDVFDQVRLAVEAAEEERSRLARTLDERDGLLRSIHRRLGGSDPARRSELVSMKAFVAAAERDVAELRRHDAWLGELGARLECVLDGDAALDAGATRAADGLRAIAVELEWRRAELAAARAAGGASRARLLAGQMAAEDIGVEADWAPLPLDRAVAEEAVSSPEEFAAAPPVDECVSFAEEAAEEGPEPAPEAADDPESTEPAAMEPPGPLPTRREEIEVRP